MIRVGILGEIGSGKTFVAKNFGYPVFNADYEVSKLYKNNKLVYKKLKKVLPKYFRSYPISKKDVSSSILAKKSNLKKIIRIIHLEVRKKLIIFLKQNKNKKIVILDIPLLLENKINKKKDVLIFIESKKKDIQKRLKKRKNYNYRLLREFRKIQLPLSYKRNKANFIIKNDFTKKTIRKKIKIILKKI